MTAPNLNELKKRWSIKDFSYRQQHKPGDFCVFVTETAPPGPCGGGVESDAYFDSTLDFLAWMRYCQVPSLVSWNHGKGDSYTIEGDAFLGMCSDRYLHNVKGLIALLDAALAADDPAECVDEILETFNGIFHAGPPSYEINAAGPDMLTFLSDPFLQEKLDEAADDEDDETGDCARLKNLIDDSELDESNEEHAQLAEEFLEGCRRF